jgi:hypothetical protein
LEPTDITVEILKDIRDEVRMTRTETNARIDETNQRLDTMREELSRRIVSSEIGTATAIAELSGAVGQMTQVLRA